VRDPGGRARHLGDTLRRRVQDIVLPSLSALQRGLEVRRRICLQTPDNADPAPRRQLEQCLAHLQMIVAVGESALALDGQVEILDPLPAVLMTPPQARKVRVKLCACTRSPAALDSTCGSIPSVAVWLWWSRSLTIRRTRSDSDRNDNSGVGNSRQAIWLVFASGSSQTRASMRVSPMANTQTGMAPSR
jgi:hypothetical protein